MTDPTPRPLEVAFLYLDLESCGRCRDADAALAEALRVTEPALTAMGVTPRLVRHHVRSVEEAQQAGLVVSPTIRVDGRDIQPEAHEDLCEDCGTLCGCAEGISCRTWAWDGAMHHTPPKALLLSAILGAAMGAGTATRPVPGTSANLARFFAGAETSGACCAPECCT
ncbi:MAG: DUF2703 domain-containing protein [Pseudomonadota bacterium]